MSDLQFSVEILYSCVHYYGKHYIEEKRFNIIFEVIFSGKFSIFAFSHFDELCRVSYS
jgi:hypothetical protein